MKKMMLLSIIVILSMLTGCRQRGIPKDLDLNGIYKLVDFMSSNINVDLPVNNPYDDNFTSEIEIEDGLFIIREIDKNQNSVDEHRFDITDQQIHTLIIKSQLYGTYQTIYYNLFEGLLETGDYFFNELRMFTYSKYEDYDNHNVTNGTYLLEHVSGYYGDGYRPQLSDWLEFEIIIEDDQYKITIVTRSNERTSGQGTYRCNIIGFETTIHGFREYLTYDPINQALSYREQITSNGYGYGDVDYLYIFRLKA